MSAVLTNGQWQTDIVVTQRRMADGSTIYFPRNQRTLKNLHQKDSNLSGWKSVKSLPRKTIIVDTEDNIIG